MNTTTESNQNNAPAEPSEAGSVQRMARRRSMCEECPFRGKDAVTKIGMALVDGFSCHMEDSPAEMGSGGIQCRGHWEAKRKRNRETPNDQSSDLEL